MAASLTIRLPMPHRGQQHVLREARRFNWLSAGRRWRKTTLAMAIVVEAALRGGNYIWGAPTYDQTRIGFGEVRRALGGAGVPNLSRMTITIPQTGGTIVFRSLDNADNVRGYTANGVVMDEAAFIRGEAWHEVLRPMLIDTNGWAWGIGTPNGRNWFYNEFVRANDHDDYRAWQIPTKGVTFVDGVITHTPHPLENPDVPFNEIAQLWRSMPQRVFEQEILGVFHADLGGIFRNVAAVSTAEPAEPGVNAQYIYGIDWAFSNDYTVVCVLDAVTARQVYLDRYNGVDYSLQRQRIMALATRYPPSLVVAETNSMGRPNNEELRRSGLPVRDFVTGAASKAAAIETLAGAIERAELLLLNDPVQIAELQAYEGERLAGGSTRYGAPSGMHDDTVMALALAYQGIAGMMPALL